MSRKSSPVGRRAHAPLLAIAMTLVAAGCDDDAEPSPGGARARPKAEVEKTKDLRDPHRPSPAWPEDVEDLPASLGAFESVDQCRRALRDRMDSALAEAIADLGYHQLLDDVCGGLAAVDAADVKGCDALSVSAVQRGCRRRLALLHARPSACPPDRVLEGREPTCLAWARRDPGLCRAAPSTDRLRCRAVLLAKTERCKPETRGDRARCKALVRRYAPALGDERRRTAASRVEPQLQLHIEPSATVDSPRTRETPQSGTDADGDALARGVFLDPRNCRWRIELADPIGDSVTTGLAQPQPKPRLRATLLLPLEPDLPLELPVGTEEEAATIEVRMPNGRVLRPAGEEHPSTITVTDFDPAHGALLAGRIDATLGRDDARWKATGAFRTYVRDLDPPPAQCKPED